LAFASALGRIEGMRRRRLLTDAHMLTDETLCGDGHLRPGRLGGNRQCSMQPRCQLAGSCPTQTCVSQNDPRPASHLTSVLTPGPQPRRSEYVVPRSDLDPHRRISAAQAEGNRLAALKHGLYQSVVEISGIQPPPLMGTLQQTTFSVTHKHDSRDLVVIPLNPLATLP
jgi:hypothetical protein